MFKPLAAAVAALALTFAALPAEAVTRRQMTQRLRQIGVTLTKGDCDNSYGTYNAETNVMCINEALFDESQTALWDETVTHEAVHVAQDCLNGFQEESLISFIANANSEADKQTMRDFVSKNLSPDYYEFLRGIDDGQIRDAEVEAYALESSPQLVYEILGSVCLGL